MRDVRGWASHAPEATSGCSTSWSLRGHVHTATYSVITTAPSLAAAPPTSDEPSFLAAGTSELTSSTRMGVAQNSTVAVKDSATPTASSVSEVP
jgi:hypothetical protein